MTSSSLFYHRKRDLKNSGSCKCVSIKNDSRLSCPRQLHFHTFVYFRKSDTLELVMLCENIKLIVLCSRTSVTSPGEPSGRDLGFSPLKCALTTFQSQSIQHDETKGKQSSKGVYTLETILLIGSIHWASAGDPRRLLCGVQRQRQFVLRLLLLLPLPLHHVRRHSISSWCWGATIDQHYCIALS